jgi:hypothetical protein
MRVSANALKEIEAALLDYEREVQSSEMTNETKHTYPLDSTNFVRWLKGEFVPGNRTR